MSPTPGPSDPTPHGRELALEDRAAIRRLIDRAAWTLDRGSREDHAALFTEEAVVTASEGRYGPSDGSNGFWEATRADAARRHCQTWHGAVRVRSRTDGADVASFVMIVQRQASATIGIYWLGYAADHVVSTPGGWRFQARTYAPWQGDVLSAFPRFRAVPSARLSGEA